MEGSWRIEIGDEEEVKGWICIIYRRYIPCSRCVVTIVVVVVVVVIAVVIAVIVVE